MHILQTFETERNKMILLIRFAVFTEEKITTNETCTELIDLNLDTRRGE